MTPGTTLGNGPAGAASRPAGQRWRHLRPSAL